MWQEYFLQAKFFQNHQYTFIYVTDQKMYNNMK